ncbi:hypothetical protein [Beijerinckia indica]|uniref:Uncharacterized protein n=1 Tax=Beijerinckia indica subsp. indica (strain ATCC 9039 / DSM 1715 / NCIMB 8712) TaxID=395963 RepID=B2IIN4_BEII9|nr:hypothetical protein [Beijerinckia indica]ACB94727.1 hypothetical protein Bind_1085 [Beijerinckia indica subsp. indica ATCC 9039]
MVQMLKSVEHAFLAKLLIYTLIAFLPSEIAIAAETEFYSQCHKLLPIADEFARECQEQARPFSRTFHPSGGPRGEVESYSIHFKPLNTPSHFVLGCVLNFKHKLDFVGLYYTARPLDMSQFNSYGIVFVDPDDNGGLIIDGIQNTFIAVRQFVTNIIPARLEGRPQNCDDAGLEAIGDAVATTRQSERFRKVDDNNEEYCMVDYCVTNTYNAFISKHTAPIIYGEHHLFMIDGNGSILIDASHYKKVCAGWKGNAAMSYNIIYEMCSISKIN